MTHIFRTQLYYILFTITAIGWQVKARKSTVPPTLQPSRNGNIVPTKEFCSGLHPPGYKRSHTSRPSPYLILSSWYHRDRLTTCILNQKGVYYFGVILQVHSKKQPVDGRWEVHPYKRDPQPLYETLVDCPPGVKNTLYLTTEKNPMWFVCFAWRPANKTMKKKILKVRVTVVRKGNIYWRTAMRVRPNFFLRLLKMKAPSTTTHIPLRFIHHSSRATTEWNWADHTFRDERGRVRTYQTYCDKKLDQILEKFDDLEPDEYGRFIRGRFEGGNIS